MTVHVLSHQFIVASSENDWLGINGSYYHFSPEPVGSYEESIRYCEERDSHLARFEMQREWRMMQNIVVKYYFSKSSLLLVDKLFIQVIS